ncbi:MAG: hypothetical protein GY915_03285 [bacterium]|nr:hypothetical protein [bacterium]
MNKISAFVLGGAFLTLSISPLKATLYEGEGTPPGGGALPPPPAGGQLRIQPRQEEDPWKNWAWSESWEESVEEEESGFTDEEGPVPDD